MMNRTQDEATVIVGKEGRVGIPAAFRHALKIKEGDELLVRIRAGSIELLTLAQKRARAREITKRFVPAKTSLVDELIKERQREAERECD